MAHREVFIQQYQFDPELDPEGELLKKYRLRLQQDVSEWLVCLNDVTVTTM